MVYVSFIGEECSSIESYIKRSIKENVSWINFKDLNDFEVLHKKALLKEGLQIRVFNQGVVEEIYRVTKDGKLEGELDFKWSPYAGKKGVHNPSDILKGKNISGGWSVYSIDMFISGFGTLWPRRDLNPRHPD